MNMKELKKKNYIHLLSGGIDSICTLFNIKRENPEANIVALIFKYGQRNSIEVKAAVNFCKKYNIKYIIKKINIYNNNYCLYLKKEHFFSEKISYEEVKKQFARKGNNIEGISNYIPNRNGVFIEIAAAIGLQIFKNEEFIISHGIFLEDSIKLGGHPDGDKIYINLVSKAIERATFGKAHLYINKYNSKKDIILKSSELGFSLREALETRSCMNGRKKECGKCPSCLDKIQGIIYAYDIKIEDAKSLFKLNKEDLLDIYYKSLF